MFIVEGIVRCYNDAGMGSDIFILIGILLAGLLLLFILLKTELTKLAKPADNESLIQWLKSMATTIDSTNKTLHETLQGTNSEMTKTLQENTRQMSERLENASKVIGELKQSLGEMSEIGKGIKTLQEFLQSPKLRGNIGEQVLSDMIGQTFPKQAFRLQYQFKSGMKADAVLKTEAGLLCIDSKFPMENFTKMRIGETQSDRESARKLFIGDVKKHIGDIAKKYILPDEETLDFALMYIPSESVYYEIVTLDEIMEYARTMRVYPVSPNTLYAHLQVLLLSFQGKELEKKSQQIIRHLRAIGRDWEKLDDQIGVLGKHVSNAYNSMGPIQTGFSELGHKISHSQELEGEETKELQTP